MYEMMGPASGLDCVATCTARGQQPQGLAAAVNRSSVFAVAESISSGVGGLTSSSLIKHSICRLAELQPSACLVRRDHWPSCALATFCTQCGGRDSELFMEVVEVTDQRSSSAALSVCMTVATEIATKACTSTAELLCKNTSMSAAIPQEHLCLAAFAFAP
ncbi:hypothetical protein J6590_015424 [Homalodisca vitripennis]|nr:hypothetical protein J6590_015424 [Homalodisca vitripennis]